MVLLSQSLPHLPARGGSKGFVEHLLLLPVLFLDAQAHSGCRDTRGCQRLLLQRLHHVQVRRPKHSLVAHVVVVPGHVNEALIGWEGLVLSIANLIREPDHLGGHCLDLRHLVQLDLWLQWLLHIELLVSCFLARRHWISVRQDLFPLCMLTELLLQSGPLFSAFVIELSHPSLQLFELPGFLWPRIILKSERCLSSAS